MLIFRGVRMGIFQLRVGTLRSLSSEESQGVVNRRFGQDLFYWGGKHATDMEICRANIIHIPTSHGINVYIIYLYTYMNFTWIIDFYGIQSVNIPFVPLVPMGLFSYGIIQGCTPTITVTHVAMALRLWRGSHSSLSKVSSKRSRMAMNSFVNFFCITWKSNKKCTIPKGK